MVQVRPREALDYFVTAVFSLMVILIVIQVIFRYALAIALTWSEETARLLFVWATFLGAAVVGREKEHIRIDYVLKKFSGEMQRLLELVIDILCIAFLLIVVLGSWRMICLTWNTRLPSARFLRIGYLYVPLFFGSVLMVLFTSSHLLGTTLFHNRRQRGI